MTDDKPLEGMEDRTSGRSGESSDPTRIVHRIDLTDWYATQVGRAVEIYVRGSSEPSAVLRPPKSWGPDWSWNLCDEGVYFRRG